MTVCARRSASARYKRITECAVAFKARETGLCFLCGHDVGWRCAYPTYKTPDRRPGKRSATRREERREFQGGESPLQSCNMQKKSSHFHASSSSNMAVRGGLTRFARPAGSLFATLSVCPTGCASCRTPVGGSHPPAVVQLAKKSPHFHASSSSNMAVRGGFEPPIRCRIHTFQACSFSHSDTSPYCFAA